MNEYKFTDLKVGLTEEFEFEVTAEKVDLFRKLSGDYNSLHVDANFAREHGFKDRVVYGMLSASLISTLGGVYLPGKYCLIQQVETKFLAPVFVGDILTVLGKVTEINDIVQRAVIKIEMRNQNNQKVVKAKLDVGFLE